METNFELSIFDPIYFNKEVQIDGKFIELLDEIKNTEIKLPTNPELVSGMIDFENMYLEKKVTLVENKQDPILLDPQKGLEIVNESLISAYDESIAYYNSLEGKVAYVSHSLLYLFKGQYYPLNHLSLLFCTSSNAVHRKIKGSILADPKWGIDTTLNVKIAEQKGKFIIENCFKNSILLIDGPFLAGDGLAYFKQSVKKLVENNVIPVFIVKNSCTSLLTDSIDNLKGEYNSDLHYASEFLKEGSRTQFYQYTDSHSRDNTKVFCYLKHKNHYSPIRVEFPSLVFNRFRESIDRIMDLVYYLIIVQGSSTNPQVRLIAVAEMYARETLKLINFKEDIIQMRLTATMNEKRGMEF